MQRLIIWEHIKYEKKKFASDEEDYEISLTSLSNYYSNQKKYEKAIPFYVEIGESKKKNFGVASKEYGTVLQDLALAYENINRKDSAEAGYLTSLAIFRKAPADTSLLISVINKLANFYTKEKNISKAEPFFIELISIVKNTKGEKHPDYIASVYYFSELYSQNSEYAKAEPWLLLATERQQIATGDTSNEYFGKITLLGRLYSKMNQIDNAEKIYKKLVNLHISAQKENQISYIESLDDLAACYFNNYKYAEAEVTLGKALAKSKKIFGADSREYADRVNYMGTLLAKMKQYLKAEPFFIEAMNIRKKLLGELHPDYSLSLNNLGELYRQMGDFEKAERPYNQSAVIIKKITGENTLGYATVLYNLSTLYEDAGNYKKAENLLLQSKSIIQKLAGDKSADFAKMLNHIASLYVKMRQYTEAEPLFIQASEIFKTLSGKIYPDYAKNQDHLALLYIAMKKYAEAESLFLETAGIWKKISGETSLDYGYNLDLQADLYRQMKQFKKAELLSIEAMQIKKNKIGESNLGFAKNLNYLADIYCAEKENTKAESLYLKANEIVRKITGDKSPIYSDQLFNLAYFYYAIGKYNQAEAVYSEIQKIEIQKIHSVFNTLSENEKNLYLKNNVVLILTNNSLIFRNPSSSPAFRNSTFNLQLLLKSLTLSDTKNILGTVRNNKDTTIQKIFSTWQTNKALLSSQYAIPATRRRIDIKVIEDETENLEKELVRNTAPLRKQQQELQINTSDVQNIMQANEAIVEMVRFPLFKEVLDSVLYAAYILRKNDSVPIFVPLCEEKQLQQLFDSAGKTATSMVNKFYRGLEIKNNGAASLGTQLYKLVWAPLEPYLKGIKKISYSPAGKLYSIAFNALSVDSNALLIDKYNLLQYTSTRQVALRTEENQTTKPSGIVLFGDANFSMDSITLVKQRKNQSGNGVVSTSIYTPQNRGSRGGVWNNLPGTAEEVKKISDLFNQNKLSTKSFIQTTASEENLKALSGNSPQILHIATHGFFLPEPDKKKKEAGVNQGNTYTLAEDPLLRSGLILAGGNYAWSGKTPIEGVEDGIATAYEISQLNLSNTELVVLSACETALGDVKGSEGVFGLQRAFKMAGVKKLIVSLWQVPDKETAELMTTFYTYWMKGKTINESFTQAQADMRKKYSPFYWAAFVLVE